MRSLLAGTSLVLGVVVTASITTPIDQPSYAPANVVTSASASATTAAALPRCHLTKRLVPTCGRLFGVAAPPVPGQTWRESLYGFQRQIGANVDIAHYYHSGQSEIWPSRDEAFLTHHGKILLANWKPTKTWRQVASGQADPFLRATARRIASRVHGRMFLTINAEMEDEVVAVTGGGHTAKSFAAMFRHVVRVMRGVAGNKIVPVLCYTGAGHWSLKPWYHSLYPGDRVVSWIAEDPYGYGTNPEYRAPFRGIVNRKTQATPSWPGFYTYMTRRHPGKPIMLAEWGVAEDWGDLAYKPRTFRYTPRAMRDRFPRLKAIVYFNRALGPMGNMSIDSTIWSLAAARRMAASGLFTRMNSDSWPR